MIITVNVSPPVEHFFPVASFRPGMSHVAPRALTSVTGPGVNVARALHHLGDDVVAVVTAGGRRGREVEERLLEEELPHRLVWVQAENPVAVTMHDGGVETSVLGPGETLTRHEIEAVVATVRGLMPARCVLLGGAAPGELFSRIGALGAPLVLDTCGPLVERLARHSNVLLACSDIRECFETLGCQDPVSGVKALVKAGARWAVVEMAPGKAWFKTGNRLYSVETPSMPIVGAAGSADALLAGLLHSMGRKPLAAIAFASACGLHEAGREGVGRLDLAACEALASRIRVVEHVTEQRPLRGLA